MSGKRLFARLAGSAVGRVGVREIVALLEPLPESD